jgi:hypothetical protein
VVFYISGFFMPEINFPGLIVSPKPTQLVHLHTTSSICCLKFILSEYWDHTWKRWSCSESGLRWCFAPFGGLVSPKNRPLLSVNGSRPLQALCSHWLIGASARPYPYVSIVLSTSWSKQYGPHRAGKNLGHKLSPRVIGATFHSRMNPEKFDNKLRGVQVYEDVLRRKLAQWVALDDDFEGWPAEVGERFIRTHLTEGISDPEVLVAIRERFKQYFGSTASS